MYVCMAKTLASGCPSCAHFSPLIRHTGLYYAPLKSKWGGGGGETVKAEFGLYLIKTELTLWDGDQRGSLWLRLTTLFKTIKTKHTGEHEAAVRAAATGAGRRWA